MRSRFYLDWNATTPLRRESREAMAAAWDLVGNPSSVHAEGRQSRKIVEQARAEVATAIGAEARNVIFTSGGTEANSLALTPGMVAKSGLPANRLIVSSIEHASVLTAGRFSRDAVETVRVSRSGVVDLDHLRTLVMGGSPALVSIMLANNETGALQPIAEIAGLVHASGSLLHVDGIQAFGKLSITINALNVDLLSVSAHKIGGPKGAGALVLREGIAGLDPLIRGGGQEKGYRAGTENVVGIAGFGAAVKVAMANLEPDAIRMENLRNRLETGLRRTRGIVVFSGDVPRLPNTTLFTSPGLKAETGVIGFDLEGIAVSSGSACSSGKVQPSHVLAAMGYDRELPRGAIRLSLGWSTTEEDVDSCLEAWRKLSSALLKADDETELKRF